MTGGRDTTSLAELVVLSLWLGAAAFFSTAVAPALFAVLPARALAGAVVGRLLPVVFYAGLVAGGVALVLDLSARGTRGAWAIGAAAVVIAACAIAQLVVAPRIERVRAAIPGAVDDLSPSDPRRVAFGRLHAVSVGWLGLAMLAAALAVVLAARRVQARAG